MLLLLCEITDTYKEAKRHEKKAEDTSNLSEDEDQENCKRVVYPPRKYESSSNDERESSPEPPKKKVPIYPALKSFALTPISQNLNNLSPTVKLNDLSSLKPIQPTQPSLPTTSSPHLSPLRPIESDTSFVVSEGNALKQSPYWLSPPLNQSLSPSPNPTRQRKLLYKPYPEPVAAAGQLKCCTPCCIQNSQGIK